ncbi:hypothetical protein A2W24_05310 [Microgenomates group bacterium RBG_16_45_19]|nr:MAG: hypothetical protein A2W24_05310 [Microgenomates group bacterium RBG_16_45_19]
MAARHQQRSAWYVQQQIRSRDQRQPEWRRRPVGNYLVLIGFGLMAAGLWSLVALFGPVLVAEAGYQVRNVTGGLTGNYGVWMAFRLPGPVPEFGQLANRGEIGLVIPKIFIKEMVVEQVNPADKPAYMKALQVGVAHALGTALPGEPGLGYYFAHSSGMSVLAPQKKAAFYLLGKLTAGDRVYLYRGDQVYSYQVTDVRVVNADDLSFLREGGTEEQIVLQTCWPIGTSLKRLLVFGERV